MTIKDLTIEIRRLNAELEDQDVKNAEIVSEEITQMLIKQGLKDLCSCGVSEQFAFLLVERAQMKEELEAECEKRRRRDHTHKLASKLNLTDNLKMSSPQIQQILDQQKDEFEEEFKHQQLMVKRLKEELRRVHETEMEKIVNEKESLKCQVSSANAKIEELVRLLSKGDVGGEDKTASWIYNILNGGLENQLNKVTKERDELELLVNQQKQQITDLTNDVKRLERSSKMLELDNQNLDFKLSEVLVQCNDLEEALYRKKSIVERRPSTIRRSSIVESRAQIDALHNIFDNKIVSAQQDLPLVDQIKRLKLEISSLRNQILTLGERNEFVTLKYQQSKARHKGRVDKMREIYFKEKKRFDQVLYGSKDQLNFVELSLKQEMSVKNRYKEDIKDLMSENATLSRQLLEADVETKDKKQQMEILNHRLKHLESENTRLMNLVSTLQCKFHQKSSISDNDV